MGDIKINSVEHVALPISDRRETLSFYRDILGLEVIPSMVDSQNIVWVGMGNGSMVHLIEPRPDGTRSGYHAGFEIEDYDGAFGALEAAGVTVDRTGHRHDGRRALYIKDPDGNVIELVSNDEPRTGHRVADEWGYTKDR